MNGVNGVNGGTALGGIGRAALRFAFSPPQSRERARAFSCGVAKNAYAIARFASENRLHRALVERRGAKSVDITRLGSL